MDVAEQCRKILLLGNPIPFDRLFVGRELGGMIHGVSIGALEFDRGPPGLHLFEGTKQLFGGVKTNAVLQ